MNLNQSALAADAKRAALVRRFYEAILVTGDWDVIAQCLSPNFTVHEAEGLPYGGTYHGIEELKALMGKITSYWDELGIILNAVATGDDMAVGVLHFSGRAKATGRSLSFPIAEMIQFENDLISTLRPAYWDTKAVIEATGG